MSYLQAAALVVDMLTQVSLCLFESGTGKGDARKADPSCVSLPRGVLASHKSHILPPGPSKIAAGLLSSPVH